jgi:hypothetical protein
MVMSTHARQAVSDLMLQRVYSEFLEMPGLRLTCQQAQRLWGLDEATCLALLEFLVETKFLCHTGRGMYARLIEGRCECLLRPLAMASAEVSPRRIKEAL